MPRLAVQSHDNWQPLRQPWCIGVLDRTREELTATLGWEWDEADEAGLGPMFYVPLAWEGRSRFLLSVSGVYPESGVSIEAEASENPAEARADFIRDTGLASHAFLAIAEGDAWFARWDPPHDAGARPATAAPRTTSR